jgi:hypothetical protein
MRANKLLMLSTNLRTCQNYDPHKSEDLQARPRGKVVAGKKAGLQMRLKAS